MFKKLCSIVLAVMIMLTVLPIPATISKAAGSTDFLIENGVLVSYTGTGGNVTIPEGVTSIGSQAFRGCSSLSDINIPNSVTLIDSMAFESCTNLTNVRLSSNVTQIGVNAFNDCPNLYCFEVCQISSNASNSYYFVYKDGFSNFLGRLSVATGDSDFVVENGVLVRYTGSDANLVIPGDLGITSIGVNTFASCSGLTSVTIPEGVTSLERGAFYYCNNLTSVTFPGSLTSIGESAFNLCQRLASVTIPEGVTNIGATAFKNCVSLTEIELPASLNQIGNGAFDTCTNLSDLYFFGNAPAMGYGVFNYAAADLNIYYYYNVSGFSDIWYGYETTPFMVVDSEAVSAFITRLYEKVLSRTAGETEIAYYMDALIGNDTESPYMTGADVGYGFIFSPEFQNRNLSNSDFLEVLYTTFMNRPSDPDGKAYWLHMLDNGVSREFVFKGFVESSEYTNICNSCGIDNGEIVLTEAVNSNPNLTMFVYRLYAMALGRPAETEGLEFHTSEILSGNTSPIDAAQNFIFSPEFESKNLSNEDYVKVLYRTFMGREFDQGGLEYHLNRITNGVSREEILNGFAYSPEFIGIMDSFGL